MIECGKPSTASAQTVSGRFRRFDSHSFLNHTTLKTSKQQMVRYEIEQNIPFPIDEIVCDRQVLGDTETGAAIGIDAKRGKTI